MSVYDTTLSFEITAICAENLIRILYENLLHTLSKS